MTVLEQAAPLGTSAKSASAPSARGVERFGRTRLRYARQGLARTLIPGERVASCLRTAVGEHVELLYVPARECAVYKGLMTCGSVWSCPVCAVKISEKRRADLRQAIETHRAKGGGVVLATFTTRHRLGDDLMQQVDGILKVRRVTKGGRAAQALTTRFGLVGSVRALEVTHGANGWHPHIHELIFTAAPLSHEAVSELRVALLDLWRTNLLKRGLREVSQEHGVDVRATNDAVAEYVAKWGKEPEKMPWGAESELAKQVTKVGRGSSRTPTALLDDYGSGDDLAGSLWKEYAMVFKGRRQLVWSAGLRDRLGLGVEKTDQELVDEKEEQAVVLAVLNRQRWSAIKGHDLRAELLFVGSTGDRAAVGRWLSDLRDGFQSVPKTLDYSGSYSSWVT